jgi:CopG family nickel-responsive transcriptional regulator
MSNREQVTRISVSLPEDLLRELDERIIRRGYASRSEFVRDLIRDLLVEDRWQDGSVEVFGVLTIVYDHHQKDLTFRIMEAQHHRHVNVLCSTHVHLDHDNCLEIIIIRGLPQQIQDVAVEIGGLRGVQFHRLTQAATATASAMERSHT